jgi:hypothetical protein
MTRRDGSFSSRLLERDRQPWDAEATLQWVLAERRQ